MPQEPDIADNIAGCHRAFCLGAVARRADEALACPPPSAAVVGAVRLRFALADAAEGTLMPLSFRVDMVRRRMAATSE